MRTLGEALVRAGRTAEGQTRLLDSDRLQAQAVDEERRDRTVATLTLQAEVRMTERDYAGAVDLWRQVIAMQRGSGSIHMRLADALVSAKRLQEAVDVYQTAISLEAGAEAHRRLADVYDALGRSDDGARERGRYLARQLESLRQRAPAIQ
jgi:tetratricopeptide (TPR) repeat protein